MRVAVLGAGNGGMAAAYDFAAYGHEVSLFSPPGFGESIADVDRAGGIRATGRLEGFAEIRSAGHDPAEAVDGAELVLAVGPAYATEPVAALVGEHLRPGQAVLVCPGSCAGAIAFKRAAGLELEDDAVLVGETSTLPYASRITDPGTVHVFLKLGAGLFLAGLPRAGTERLMELVGEVYEAAVPAASVMQTTLQNGNPIIHPAVTLLNTGLLERTGGDFLFYEEGVTDAVGRLIEAVDRERLSLAAALGLDVLSEPEIGVLQGYMTEPSYGRGYREAPGFRGIGAQDRLEHRYLTEDVGWSLVFLCDLGRRLGVPTPRMDALVTLASTVLDRDLAAAAPRTLATLGLGGLDAAALRAL